MTDKDNFYLWTSKNYPIKSNLMSSPHRGRIFPRKSSKAKHLSSKGKRVIISAKPLKRKGVKKNGTRFKNKLKF